MILTYPMAYAAPVRHILQVKVGGQLGVCGEESPYVRGCHVDPWSGNGSVYENASVKTANCILQIHIYD